MRLPRLALLCLVIGTPAHATPQPPTDPCAVAAFNELAQVQARAKSLAAATTVTLADKLELAMDVPTGYVMQSPGRERFRDLFAATDAKTTAPILADIDRDLDALLVDGGSWRYRCEAYPSSHLAAKPVTQTQLATRRAIAKRTVAAHARAADCARLQGRVLAAPEAKRFAFTSALDRCHRDLELAHAQCDKDFATIEHTDAFAPWHASLGVSNLIELRNVHAIAATDVTAARARIEPMLDALPLPLSALAKPSRDALSIKDPIGALYELSGALKILYSPCEQLWTSESRCIVRPESCRKRPN
ncbi:MAG TPA: hypothetical protein VIV40_14125 [Kofleriaceae bacterium]